MGRNHLATQFKSNNSRYIDDVMSINNPNLMDYPHALETKDTSDGDIFVSLFDKSISCDVSSDYFIASLNDKEDGFNFNIICFPFLDSYIPSTPANGIVFRN